MEVAAEADPVADGIHSDKDMTDADYVKRTACRSFRSCSYHNPAVRNQNSGPKNGKCPYLISCRSCECPRNRLASERIPGQERILRARGLPQIKAKMINVLTSLAHLYLLDFGVRPGAGTSGARTRQSAKACDAH